jgi:cyanate permease
LFKSNYKWYILALAMLSYGLVTGAARLCLPVLFKEISIDLNLSMVSIGTIWGMDPLAGVFVGIPGGLLADRFGIKRTLVVACLLSGAFCALRRLSNDFATLVSTMFLFGLATSITFVVAPKITAVWFSGKDLGTANALLMVSMSVFSMIATMLSATTLSPWLGGWRVVMLVWGLPAVLIGVLWWITGREPRKGEIPETTIMKVPFQQAFSKVIRIREVWIFGLVMLTFMGSMTGMSGYLAIYLRNIGWSNVGADTAVTVASASSLVGIFPVVLLANRLRSHQRVFILCMIMLGASLAAIPFVGRSGLWPLLIFNGFLRSGAAALTNTLIFEIKGVGGTYGGTALGLASTLGMLGAFGAPPLGNQLASLSPGTPFIFWSILPLITLPLFLLIREKTGRPDKLAEAPLNT